MIAETLILVIKQTHYRVCLNNYTTVSQTDIAVLLNKSVSDVWRWARRHRAKVYFEEFQPVRRG